MLDKYAKILWVSPERNTILQSGDIIVPARFEGDVQLCPADASLPQCKPGQIIIRINDPEVMHPAYVAGVLSLDRRIRAGIKRELGVVSLQRLLNGLDIPLLPKDKQHLLGRLWECHAEYITLYKRKLELQGELVVAAFQTVMGQG